MSQPIRLQHGSAALRCPPRRTHASFSPRRPAGPRPLRAAAADPDIPDGLERDVEASSAMIDAMMRSLSQALLVDAGANYVTGEEVSADEQRRLVAAAVAPLLDQLNDTFVATLDAYVTGAQERGPAAASVVEVLLALRAEVLAQLQERLSPALRVLGAALEAPSPDERMEVLRRHISGGAEPRCEAGELERGASELVDDMEGMVEVPDRRLLARLCLLREELQLLQDEAANLGAAEGGGGGGGGGPRGQGQGSSPFSALRAVPRATVAFLKQVMVVSSPERRRALLEKAFREDWDGGAGGPAGGGAARDGGGASPAAAVRPGRFLDSVKALQAELLGPQYRGGAGVDPGTLVRLEEVRREALLVLADLAGEAAYSP